MGELLRTQIYLPSRRLFGPPVGHFSVCKFSSVWRGNEPCL